jgi:hypothetical protein
MKLTGCFTVLLFVSLILSGQQQQEVRVSCVFDDVTFEEFVHELEEKNNLRFFYLESWVAGLKINIQADSLPITKLMTRALISSRLGFVFKAPDKIYLLPDRNFVNEIPDYFVSDEVKTRESQDNETESLAEKRYLKGREPDMIETIVIGTRQNARAGRNARISGRLTQEDTGEPLIGATLFIKDLGKGAATDANGIFTIALPPGKYSSVFQCVGIEEVKCILDVRSDGFFSLPMEQKITSIAEVTISAAGSYTRGADVGYERIAIKTIKELPSLMGEKDVLKISQMLPGVVSISEASSGVYVRGSSADQNLFYVNRIPVYNTSHLFGFFSVINSTIIKDFSIYKGHVPAEYGGRLASVFTIETRKGNKNKFFTQGGVSPVSANIELEAPFIKQKGSFLLSARSSYSDWILKRLKEPSLRNSKGSFYDFAASADYEINDKNHLNFFSYYSEDYFNLNGQTEYGYSNLGASAQFMHRFAPGLKATVALTGSRYYSDIIENSLPSEAYQHDYTINHYEFKSSLNWLKSDVHSLSLGTDLIYYQLDKGTVQPYGIESMREEFGLGREQGMESSVFVDDEIKVRPWLSLYAGLRYSHFTEYGPKDVMTYFPENPKEEVYSDELIHYDPGEKIVSYQGPEARLSADIRINGYNSIKMSYNQMRQYLFMMSNTYSIAPHDQWKLVDYHISPPRSNQVAAGYYRLIPSAGLSASGELYYKFARKIIEYKDGADFLASPYTETTILQGNQEAYGLEFMLSKPHGKLNGWISYTWSRSLITVNGARDWEKINFGKTFPSNYDKPHVCNIILNYRFNRRLSLSSNIAYSTGRPVTLPNGIYYMEEKPYVDYSDRNEYRIPDYFRIDFSVSVEGNLKQKKPFHHFWMFSFYNLTGRNNPYSIYFRSEEGYMRGYQYSIIGRTIFTVSWNFKLGNYAND